MAYVITQSCCNDASCVAVCPVDCIHPRPDEPQFVTAEMLYIDPAACIDCGACVEECPVDAVKADDDLTEDTEAYLDINAGYYEKYPINGAATAPLAARPPEAAGLRVAVVGSGPSGFYAATELMARRGVEVDLYDRLPTPYGLIRAGVAPDHPETKAVAARFERSLAKPNLRLHLGIEVGKDITHEEMLAHHHAVIYAVGASGGRELGISGEDLPGCHTASDFVAWYNGHPDAAQRRFDLSTERAVIVGNGNVALDVARILAIDPDELDRTDIASHAVAALRRSEISEIVVLGRRGHAQAAFTTPELMALQRLPGVDLIVRNLGDNYVVTDDSEPHVVYKSRLLEEIAAAEPSGALKRIVLDFCGSPVAVVGDTKSVGLTIVRNQLVDEGSGVRAIPTDRTETLECGLVLSAVGYRGKPIPGVPFDDARGVIPNDAGRVVDPAVGDVARGVYVTGWIKRGPSGVIGTNKLCATQTVDKVVDDYRAGLLAEPVADQEAFLQLATVRQPNLLDAGDWKAIDKAERTAGKAVGRTRLKFTDISSMIAASGPRS